MAWQEVQMHEHEHEWVKAGRHHASCTSCGQTVDLHAQPPYPKRGGYQGGLPAALVPPPVKVPSALMQAAQRHSG